MWVRETFHDCARDLSRASKTFRSAYSDHAYPHRQQVLQEESVTGIEVLRILALAIRSEQDYGVIPKQAEPVGSLIKSLSQIEASQLIADYSPLFDSVGEVKELHLRDALNKVAHANPRTTGFYADQNTHNLLLMGDWHGDYWVAILSIVDFCKVVKALPDCQLSKR